MADEPTFEEMGPLDDIGKFLLPRREPTEFNDLENPLEGSVLDELVKDPLGPPDQPATLPSTLRTILLAALHLKAIGTSPDAIRQLRGNLGAARKLWERWESFRAPKDVPIPESVEEWLQNYVQNDDGSEYRLMDRQLFVLEEAARMFESAIRRGGYRWNWDTRVIEILPGRLGGRPRQLLRDLVRTLLLHYGFANNTAEVREKIASELAPFFSAGLLDTSKGSPLSNAVDHSLAVE